MLDAIVASYPCLIKSREKDGKRLVEVEASNEKVDSEGDIILQRALLDSADYFVKSGNLDIDHLSELGNRLRIPNPASYIIGRPVEVKDLGHGRTGVVGEISRSKDGKVDPAKNKYDEFWESLQREPPVVWQASIYGFPKSDQVEDCRDGHCSSGATRFLVKGMEWRSLAFTRNPINTSLKGHAHIVTAKAWCDAMMKASPYGGLNDAMIQPPTFMMAPRSTHELWGQYERHIRKDCPFAGPEMKNRHAFKNHFTNCALMDPDHAELMANALMQMVQDEAKREK